jgi:protein-tyrosine phosphatase
VRGAGEAPDWVPGLGPLGRRLARRCWPGPLALRCGDGADRGLASRLPEAVRGRVLDGGAVWLRTPAHEAIQAAMRLVPGPLLLAAEPADGPCPVTAAEAAETFGGRAALVIDDGPAYFGRPATAVRVEGERWEVVREGPLAADALAEVLACTVLFICTGNTCRSPLAEALCKKLLAERLGCAADELPARGFRVLSAGIAAMMGGEAAAEAVDIARELGADLSGHRSRPLTRELLAQADHIIVMTAGHLRALSGHCPPGASAPRLLSGEGHDVPDPIGGPPEVYRECAREILQHLQGLLPRLQ